MQLFADDMESMEEFKEIIREFEKEPQPSLVVKINRMKFQKNIFKELIKIQ